MTRKLWIDYQKLRQELDFQSILKAYQFDFKPGTQVQVHCPFHEDNSPSCSINTDKNIFRCFGCNASGNALEFVVMMEGGNTESKDDMYSGAQKAIEILGLNAADFGKSSSSTPKAKAKARKTASATDVANEDEKAPQTPAAKKRQDNVAKPNIKTPTENKLLDLVLTLEHEHPFLEERGVTPEQAERYELGYCKGGIMKGRIAIPIHNPSGQLVGYVGRWASEDIPEKEERYRFPKGFHKSLELYNIHRAAQNNHQRHLTLVEGYWSAIRWHDAGIPVAALMGTSLSDEQAQLVRDAGFKYVTLLLDGDDAGRLASAANASILAKYIYVRIVELPEGEKPDSVPDDFLDGFR